MKKAINVLGFVALVTVIGFSFISCKESDERINSDFFKGLDYTTGTPGNDKLAAVELSGKDISLITGVSNYKGYDEYFISYHTPR